MGQKNSNLRSIKQNKRVVLPPLPRLVYCMTKGCQNQIDIDSYGSHCKDCTCIISGCQSSKEIGKERCQNHREKSCNYKNCTNTWRADYRLGAEYCVDHTCCYKTRKQRQPGTIGYCHNETKPLSKHCQEHGCNYEDCDLEVISHERQFCKNHICQHLDGKSRCTNSRFSCPIHQCQIAECSNSYLDANISYCDGHTCKYLSIEELQTPQTNNRNCHSHNRHNRQKTRYKKTRCTTGVIDHEYCRKHRCYVADCEEQRTDLNQQSGSNYCQDHKCLLCPKRVAKLSDQLQSIYCKEHECDIDNCINKKADGDVCCIQHDDAKCQVCHDKPRQTEKVTCKTCKIRPNSDSYSFYEGTESESSC